MAPVYDDDFPPPRDVDEIPVEPFGKCDPSVARAPYPGSVRVIPPASTSQPAQTTDDKSDLESKK